MSSCAGDARPSLLYLCHRIPYPPNKGDKVRSWNWLRRLSVDYRISLATFVDDADDWQHEGVLREYCERLCLRPLTTAAKLRRAALGMLRGAALTTSAYEDRTMHRFVADVVATGGADRVLLFSSGMLPYIGHCDPRTALLDFVDVDSIKWGQYERTAGLPMRYVYGREAVLLRDAEANAARAACATTFVSAPEAALFEEQLALSSANAANSGGAIDARVEVVGNGVDTAYFDPSSVPSGEALPLPAAAPLVVFTGAMDYPPNADAAAWFVEASWPAIRARVPDAQFAVVGARPTEAVKALARVNGVTVTGTVPDVRPWLARARVAVAPLRVARGIQNKVLEAMAMGLAVVSTTAAAEGIVAGHDISVCADAADDVLALAIADATSDLLAAEPCPLRAPRRRAFVVEHYDWDAAAARLRELLGDQPAPPTHKRVT